MMTSQKIYEKDRIAIRVHDKFIYLCEVYRMWSNGFALEDSKYYASSKPLVLKKKDLVLKKKEYTLRRFFDLEFAPEEYLINNGFKLLENET